MNDPIIDTIIRIKNSYMTRNESLVLPYTQYKEQVLKKLQDLKLIESYEVSADVKKMVKVKLTYDNGAPAVTDVKIFSRPGRRWYIAYIKLKPVLGGFGHAIISTSQGILTDREAKKQKIGGELLFHIW